MATTQQTLTDVEPSLVDKYVTEDGSTIETRETDDGTVEEQCPTCGNWYQKIASHWAKSSCPHPPISQRKWQMCKGLMMGDGSLGNRDNKNCRIQITNTNITFLEYLQDEFGWLSSTLYKDQTAQKGANQLNRCGVGSEQRETEAEDCVDMYRLHLSSHPVFNQFEKWWNTGEKTFPHIKYTKSSLGMWWISDGNLNWNSSGNSTIRFVSAKEGSRPENIIESFKKVGFDCNLYGDYTFALPVSQTEDFFDYIGHDPVPGFEYKWAWQDRDRYERLKKECREKHCTQTIE
jgi:hypothetical protein